MYKITHIPKYFKVEYNAGTRYKLSFSPSYYKVAEGAMVDVLAPVLQTAIIPADGLSVVLTYNEALNEASTPLTGAFTLNGTASVVNSVIVSGTTVSLGLDTAIFDTDVVTLDYTSGASPIQDVAGNNAANLVGQGVTNNSTVSAVVVCSGVGQSFNGIDQYAFVADNGALDVVQSSTYFSLSFNVKSNNPSTRQNIVGKLSLSRPVGEYGFYISSTRLRLFFTTSTQSYDTPILLLTSGLNYHIVLMFDLINKKAFVYVNGVSAIPSGIDYLGDFASVNNIYTFNLNTAQRTDGDYIPPSGEEEIKDVRIYHKDMSSQLTELQAGEQLGDEVAWWCLPQLTGFGGTSFDLTGVNI